MHLTPEQQIVCRRDFDSLELRIKDTEHRFYREVLINAMQAAILDFFDFHARIYGESDISTQNASVMSRFLKMLEEGTYREHREVADYADRLCVTSKYLSEVSKKVSGYAANYWINRYTILDITRLLRDKSLTFVQISDMFGFSSPAYFSRYVQQHLGMKPNGLQGIDSLSVRTFPFSSNKSLCCSPHSSIARMMGTKRLSEFGQKIFYFHGYYVIHDLTDDAPLIPIHSVVASALFSSHQQ